MGSTTQNTEPEPFLRGIAEQTGPALGVAAAVSSELIQLGWTGLDPGLQDRRGATVSAASASR